MLEDQVYVNWYGCFYYLYDKRLKKMKTKTKEKRKKYGKAHASPQRSDQDRGLNEDNQKKITNSKSNMFRLGMMITMIK